MANHVSQNRSRLNLLGGKKSGCLWRPYFRAGTQLDNIFHEIYHSIVSLLLQFCVAGLNDFCNYLNDKWLIWFLGQLCKQLSQGEVLNGFLIGFITIKQIMQTLYSKASRYTTSSCTQCPRTDLSKRFLPKKMTTTG